MRNAILIVTVLAAAAGGCASQCALGEPVASMLRAGIVNDPAQVSRLEKAMTDRDIADMLDVDVRAKLPTAVAVAKVRSRCSGYQPELVGLDAEELNAWEEAFKGQDLLTGVQPVSNLALGGVHPTVHSLRAAAARMNCELLLVYLQADSTVDNFNDAAVLYWTILGLWTVPGSVLEHKTVMQAILVDCRTGMILGTATGDCHLKKVYPAAFEDVRRAELSKQAPRKALADLQTGARGLAGRVVTAALAARR